MKKANLCSAYDAIIFDMDGVLVDSERIHVKAEKLTCKHFGMNVPAHEWEYFQGRTARDIADYLIEKYQHSGVFTSEQFISRKTNIYLELARAEITPIDGAVEFVGKARKNFLDVGLVTSSNGKIQQYVFHKYFSDVKFDIVVTGDDIPIGKGKPDPFPYLAAIKQLGFLPERCMVVEDSDNGVISAKAAGCFVVGITTSFSVGKLISVGADVVVNNYLQMSDLIFD